MKRAAIERPRTKNTWAMHQRLSRGRPGSGSELSVGHFRKSSRVGGCGNTACMLCHWGKLLGDERPAERRSWFNYAEGLAEAQRSNTSLRSSPSRPK